MLPIHYRTPTCQPTPLPLYSTFQRVATYLEHKIDSVKTSKLAVALVATPELEC